MQAQVTHKGTITILPDLVLHNVLCIPSFSFNLLSVSKLAHTNQYCFIILHDYCILQALSSWTMIGHAKLKSGLYFLQQPTTHQRHLVSSPSILSKACFPFNKKVCHVSADV